MGADTTRELESTRVTRTLRDDIMLGRRMPGSRLVEREIAAELNVSRLPVREGIRALVNEGIVVTRPHKWAVVREFTPQDVQDFAEVRETIEMMVFVLAAQRHTAEDLAALNQVLLCEEEAALAGDLDEARTHAAAFHAMMPDLAKNEMLSELVSVFVTRMRWLFGQHEGLLRIAGEHRQLYDALAARDTDAIRRLLPAHISTSKSQAELRTHGLGAD